MDKIALPPAARILLVRNDKLGDLILTTPALMRLREAYPQAHIAFLCKSYTAPVLKENSAVNEVIVSDAPDTSFWALIQKIREGKFDAAVHFYCEPRSVWLTALAGIPLRVGPFSKPSALLLNRRVRQKRSEVKRHEAEYNLELVEILGARGTARPPVIVLSEKEKETGRRLAAEVLGSSTDLRQKPVIIHPGSAGSAKNWPIESYLELAKKLAEAGHSVIITVGPGEGWISKKAEGLKNPKICVFRGDQYGLRELAGVIGEGRLMVSNSTGPLHVAVALNIPTCSLYPAEPVVTSAKRWGPFGDPKTNLVLSPEHPRAGMASISVDRAFTTAKSLI